VLSYVLVSHLASKAAFCVYDAVATTPYWLLPTSTITATDIKSGHGISESERLTTITGSDAIGGYVFQFTSSHYRNIYGVYSKILDVLFAGWIRSQLQLGYKIAVIAA
jgi:hypothetical protein